MTHGSTIRPRLVAATRYGAAVTAACISGLALAQANAPRQLPTLAPMIETVAPAVVNIAVTTSIRSEPQTPQDELLRRYHNHLLEGGVKDYSFEQLKTDYRGYFAGVIAGGVVLLGTLPEGNERGRRLIETTMNRFLTAMQDHDSLALLPE